MIVFESIIDTMFICFLVDADINKGGNMLAPPCEYHWTVSLRAHEPAVPVSSLSRPRTALQKLVGDYSAHSKQAAMDENKLRQERPGAIGTRRVQLLLVQLPCALSPSAMVSS